jgi:hypothetical protein
MSTYNHLANVKKVWFNCSEYKSMIKAKWAALYSVSGVVAYYEPKSFRLVDAIDREKFKIYTPDFYLPNKTSTMKSSCVSIPPLRNSASAIFCQRRCKDRS